MNVNADLCRALGLDPSTTARVVLTIEPGALPTLQVTRHVRTADGLQTAVQMLELRPVPRGSLVEVTTLGDAAERFERVPAEGKPA